RDHFPARHQPRGLLDGGGRPPHADLRDGADAARVLVAVAPARPPACRRLAVRRLSRAGGRGAVLGGGRAREGRSAARAVHGSAADQRPRDGRRRVGDRVATRARGRAGGAGRALGNDGRRRSGSPPLSRLRWSYTTATISKTSKRSWTHSGWKGVYMTSTRTRGAHAATHR